MVAMSTADEPLVYQLPAGHPRSRRKMLSNASPTAMRASCRNRSTRSTLAERARLPLFDVPQADELMGALSSAAASTVRRKVGALHQRLAPHLLPLAGPLTRNEISCLTSAQQGCPVGAVVLVRQNAAVIEQYAFPFLNIDASTGAVTYPPIPAPAGPAGEAAPARIAPHADVEGSGDGGRQTVQQIIGVGMAVTPFLPPPFNAVLTGTLAVFNFLVGLVPDDPGKSPDLLGELKTALETYIQNDDIRAQQGILAGVRNHFNDQAMSQTQDALHLTSIDGGITDLLQELRTHWVHDAEAAVDQLYTLLRECTTDNFDSALGTMVSGVTLDLTLKNAEIMIGAIKASVAWRHRDMAAYTSAMSSWTAAVLTVQKEIGTSRTDPWDDDATVDGLRLQRLHPSDRGVDGEGEERPTGHDPGPRALLVG